MTVDNQEYQEQLANKASIKLNDLKICINSIGAINFNKFTEDSLIVINADLRQFRMKLEKLAEISK